MTSPTAADISYWQHKTYLLLNQRRKIPSDGSQSGQFRIFADDPLDEFAKRQQEGVPVFRVVLQTVPVTRANDLVFLAGQNDESMSLCYLMATVLARSPCHLRFISSSRRRSIKASSWLLVCCDEVE